MCLFSLGQSRNWAYNQQRLMSQRQSQEQHRQQEARRVDRERQLQAGLRDEDSFDRKRHLRQVQQELKEREMESALLRVCLSTGRQLTRYDTLNKVVCVYICVYI